MDLNLLAGVCLDLRHRALAHFFLIGRLIECAYMSDSLRPDALHGHYGCFPQQRTLDSFQ